MMIPLTSHNEQGGGVDLSRDLLGLVVLAPDVHLHTVVAGVRQLYGVNVDGGVESQGALDAVRVTAPRGELPSETSDTESVG